MDPVAYADLNAVQTDACDLAIDVFARYLTHLGEANRLEGEAGIPVTREMILEDEGAYLVHEATFPNRFSTIHEYVFLLDPFKDEGGPSQVILFFRNYGSMPEVLDTVLWEFDTDYTIIPQEWWVANVNQEVRT